MLKNLRVTKIVKQITVVFVWNSAQREKFNFYFSEGFCLKMLPTRLQSFLFLFMSLVTVLIVKNSHILAGIYFIFLKNVHDQTWKSFNTKFRPQWKDRKSSYQSKTDFSIFLQISCCNFRLKLSKALELRKLSDKFNLEGSGASLKEKTISRENHSQNIWGKF